MSSSVDSRILTMKIDNQSFLTGVAATVNALANLKNAMNMGQQTKGLNDLQAAGSRFNLGAMGAQVDGISAKFLAMSTVAITALANITNRAVDAGIQLTKSLTVEPATEGFSDYERKLTSVQTVMNATGRDLQDVSGFFNQLDTYADKTIYNLDDMTGALAKFTNAGVSLEQAVPAIKGISNMTALAGQGAESASIAYYNLSQSLASGFLSRMDFKSLELANVATKTFRNEMIQTAVAQGQLTKSGDKYTTSSGKSFTAATLFTEGLQEQWASADVLTKTLGRYGDETTAIGKKSQAAAQDVKSLPMMLETLKASVGTGWTDTFEIVLGTLPEAKKLFTGLTNEIGGILTSWSEARNKLLHDWKDLGGRTELIKGISAGWENFLGALKPIRDAFRDIFPATTGKQLADLTKRFRDFMENLKIGSDTAENLRRTFRGVFAVFDILWQVVKGVFGVFTDLFGVFGEGSGGILSFTGSIGDMLVSWDEAIKKGSFLTDFFNTLSNILATPIRLIQDFAGFMRDAFSGMDGPELGNLEGLFTRLGERFSWLSGLGDKLAAMFDRLQEIFAPLGQKIGEALTGIGDKIADAFSGGDFSGVMDALNVGLFAGILLLVRKFVNNGLSVDFGGGLFGQIGDSFDQLTDTMKAMQTQIQAKTLLTIAGAIGLLTASVVALSLIDSGKLTKALTAMSVGFGQLLGAMAILVKISGTAGFVKVPLIAGSMVLLALAIGLLTGAIALMGQLSWETIGKGLAGTAGAIVVLGTAMQLMPVNLPITAAGLVLLGVALTEIAGVIALMSRMSWKDIGKGLAAMAGAMVILGASLMLMGPSVLLVGPGLIAVGIALGMIAGVMKIFASMSWEEIGKAMVGLAGSLAILAAALYLMSGSLLGAAALLVVAPALLALGTSMKMLATLSWGDIARALVGLGGALLVLAVGLTAMIVALPGALALLVVSPALALLAGVLVTLGNMSWGDIIKGLVALAGALTVIGIAGLLMTPIVGPLILLGVAMTLIGAGFALAGVGVLAFATAFALFVANGTAGIALIGELIAQIPAFAVGVARGITAFIVALAEGSEQIVQAMQKLIISMIDGITEIIPKMRIMMVSLVNNGLAAVRQTFPNVVRTGLAMLLALLDGLENNADKIVDGAADVVVAFTKAVGDKAKDLATAGKTALGDFIGGIKSKLTTSLTDMTDAGWDLAYNLVTGMANGLAHFASKAVDKAKDLGNDVIDAIGNVTQIFSPSRRTTEQGEYIAEGLANGIDNNAKMAVSSAEKMATGALGVIGMAMSKVGDVLPETMNLSPTVTPVLDLSNLAQSASQIDGLLSTTPIQTGVSLSQAEILSAEVEESRRPDEEESPAGATPEIKIEQNNYSPKPLDPAEVYRNTKSLMAQVREELKV